MIVAALEKPSSQLSNAANLIENGYIHAALWTPFEMANIHVKILNEGNIRHSEFRIQKKTEI